MRGSEPNTSPWWKKWLFTQAVVLVVVGVIAMIIGIGWTCANYPFVGYPATFLLLTFVLSQLNWSDP